MIHDGTQRQTTIVCFYHITIATAIEVHARIDMHECANARMDQAETLATTCAMRIACAETLCVLRRPLNYATPMQTPQATTKLPAT